ncbi:hypothetical protein [Poseidonibacter lekithochrous]|nr:hypothetical protein [Poseidonibacter lekithochrous]
MKKYKNIELIADDEYYQSEEVKKQQEKIKKLLKKVKLGKQ